MVEERRRRQSHYLQRAKATRNPVELFQRAVVTQFYNTSPQLINRAPHRAAAYAAAQPAAASARNDETSHHLHVPISGNSTPISCSFDDGVLVSEATTITILSNDNSEVSSTIPVINPSSTMPSTDAGLNTPSGEYRSERTKRIADATTAVKGARH